MRSALPLLFVLALLFVSFAGFASAKPLQEKTLNELSAQELLADGVEQEKCSTIYFQADTGGDERVFTAFSMHAEFFPQISRHAKVSFTLNDEVAPFKEIDGRDMQNNWFRLVMPREAVKEGTNSLEVCFKTGGETTQMILRKDSKIGAYYLPDFSVEGAFTKTTESDSPLIGKEFEVAVSLKNFGSEDALVEVAYLDDSFEEYMTEIQLIKVLSGNSKINALVPAYNFETKTPGEEELKFQVQGKRAVQMTLLPAVLSYNTSAYFGDDINFTERIKSTRPTIKVRNPEVKIRPYILSEGEIKKIGETNEVQIALKNEGVDEATNIAVSVSAQPGLDVGGQQEQLVSVIAPKETKYLEFSASAQQPGSYNVGCEIVSQDYELVKITCTPARLTFEGTGLSPTLIAAAVFIIIGLAVYLFIIYSGEKTPSSPLEGKK
ncbi:MAG: hypothetical protein V1494_05615 [Candidatus Diapherotrites archaeon]